LGVNLTPIMRKRVVTLEDLKGKRLAVDANNFLYQFLALVRTRDGTPLKDSHGNVTSHLMGLMFRSTRLIHDFSIDLVFVFDGQPPPLKEEEIRSRRRQREKARLEWQQAKRERDYAKAFSKAVMTSRLTQSMIDDAKTVLRMLGIPHVQAPSEAEAQAAFMAIQGDAWAVSSRDYDGILFGAPNLLRFLTVHGKEYLPSKGMTRPLKPELIALQGLLSHHGIDRTQLVDLAILVGTDFNQGIRGVGPKTALKLIKEFGSLEGLPRKFRSSLPPNYQRVRDIFLHPETTLEYSVEYGILQEDELYRFLCQQRDFAEKRVEKIVKRMKSARRQRQQSKLENWAEGKAQRPFHLQNR
jgi:flap endonuclease-1